MRRRKRRREITHSVSVTKSIINVVMKWRRRRGVIMWVMKKTMRIKRRTRRRKK